MNEWLDTISAAGTLVAIGTSLFLLAQGQRDRREVASERKREQASRVTCWAEWNFDWEGATLAQPACPSIRVRNTSDAAVYEVFVDLIGPADGQAIRADIGAVGPGATARWNYEEPFNTDGSVPDALMPRLFFRDASGQEWKRTARGVLVPDPGAVADGPVKQLPRQGKAAE
ncbi:hypothetical protein [Nocardioides houyundeii]|uniref:hypothetical protein n=1 Tax=Nocardioides houyundeii TaxID=2045452 RepID=UPI0013B3B0A6|nr:hypothetical protein [Nocardioides houyundeii]